MDFDWLKFARLAGAGLASICTFLFGAPDIWLLTLLAFIVIDYISGVIAAYIHHELSSQVGFIGILKKTMYFFVVAVAHCVDVATGAGGVLQGIGYLHSRKLCGVRHSHSGEAHQGARTDQGR